MSRDKTNVIRNRLRLNSIESLSAVDGPGVRFVVFLQGCPLRCKYCHNPETWDSNGGQHVGIHRILDRVDQSRRLVPELGLTVSGGEPLLQPGSCRKLLESAKSRGIHTALDTSGYGDGDDLVSLLPFVDVVLYDVKAVDGELHRRITGHSNEQIIRNLALVSRSGARIWIRRVLIPGINDTPAEASGLRALIEQYRGIERVDVIPYHRMGLDKWAKLGWVYAYEDIEVPDREAVERFRSMLPCLVETQDLTWAEKSAYHIREVSAIDQES